MQKNSGPQVNTVCKPHLAKFRNERDSQHPKLLFWREIFFPGIFILWKYFLRKILKSNFVNLIFDQFFFVLDFLISWNAVFFLLSNFKTQLSYSAPSKNFRPDFFCPLMHILHYIYLNLISWTLKIISFLCVFNSLGDNLERLWSTMFQTVFLNQTRLY